MSECKHNGYRESMAYCPDCGERHTGLVIAEKRIAELLECNEEWRLDFASLEGENRRLEQQLAEMKAENKLLVDRSSNQIISDLRQQLTELREALEAGVNRFYQYEGEPAYEKMKAALLKQGGEGGMSDCNKECWKVFHMTGGFHTTDCAAYPKQNLAALTDELVRWIKKSTAQDAQLSALREAAREFFAKEMGGAVEAYSAKDRLRRMVQKEEHNVL